jgi:hypothetical protein
MDHVLLSDGRASDSWMIASFIFVVCGLAWQLGVHDPVRARAWARGLQRFVLGGLAVVFLTNAFVDFEPHDPTRPLILVLVGALALLGVSAVLRLRAAAVDA